MRFGFGIMCMRMHYEENQSNWPPLLLESQWARLSDISSLSHIAAALIVFLTKCESSQVTV